MKKLFTIDDIMIAFVSSLGYGFSDTISRQLGWPMFLCIGATMVLGIALEGIINRIVFSEAIQKKPENRIIIYVAFFVIFVIAHCVSVATMGVSMVDYLLEQYVYVIGLPILGFVVNLLIRAYRICKIRKRYGDGSEGYVFDMTSETINEVNQRNQPISSGYDADCAVKTRTGTYVGERQKETITFLGIPYAKPPVGDLRWRAPVPLPASQAAFEAKHFGPSAIQVEHKGSIVKHHLQSEDCLYLNICVGTQKTESLKPVLVLFHHGDFTCGGSADPLLYGDNFVNAHPDTVFVSFDYRLGIFGFIDFSQVPGGEERPDALNLGLLDQIAALEWIKENIAAFGGDPEQITVIGFGAGATSICLLSVCAKAKGLFQRAFVFNGSPESAYDTPEAARALAKHLAKETKASTMATLLQLKTGDLKAAAQKLWLDMCAPTCDGVHIPDDVYRAWEEGAASDIEFIIGIPTNERQVVRSIVGNQNYSYYIPMGMAEIRGNIDDALAEALQAYIKAQSPSLGKLEVKSTLLEHWNALCVYHSAVKLSAGGSKVHLMYWDEKPLIEKLGSGTVVAAATLLGNDVASQMYGSVVNVDLSEILQCMLHKYISGNALQLYTNEIKGIDALDWKAFPQALIVSDGSILCDTIEDRITQPKELLLNNTSEQAQP